MPPPFRLGNNSVLRYAVAVLAVGAGWLLRMVLERMVGPTLPPYTTFYPAIMLGALLAGFGPRPLARR